MYVDTIFYLHRDTKYGKKIVHNFQNKIQLDLHEDNFKLPIPYQACART